MTDPVYKQNKEVIFRQEQEEAILFNPDNSDIVFINSTGCFIWDLCNGKNSQKDIIDTMLNEFDTTKDKAEEDLSKFLSDLESRKFVEKVQ